MPKTTIKKEGWECCRCKHTWIPNNPNDKEKPKTCPKCRSPYWDTPKKEDKKK